MPGLLRLSTFGVLLLAAGLLTGYSARPGGLIFPEEYREVVEMWRGSGDRNRSIADTLNSSEWATVVLPLSILELIQEGQDRLDPISIAQQELSKGRFGATLPVFRRGIGTLVVINDLKTRRLVPTGEAQDRELQDPGYLERIRKVTLAAVMAHEATHSLQFLRGHIYPGPGVLPFPGHDQHDELEAYLNIDAIYQQELGLSLPDSRYLQIIREDYSNLPGGPLSLINRSAAFIQERKRADTQDGYGPPSNLREAILRILSNQESSE